MIGALLHSSGIVSSRGRSGIFIRADAPAVRLGVTFAPVALDLDPAVGQHLCLAPELTDTAVAEQGTAVIRITTQVHLTRGLDADVGF